MKNVTDYFNVDLDEFLTTRAAASAVGVLAAACSVWLAIATGDLWRKYHEERSRLALSSADGEIQAPVERGSLTKKNPTEEINSIVSRNLFGSKAPSQQAPATASAQQLKMRLVGTNIGSQGGAFAIVEDLNKNEQDVFVPQDSLFGRAKLLDVASDKIKIEINGKSEILVLDDGGPVGTPSSDTGGGGDDQTEFTVPEQELSEALGNLPVLLSQARAVPYFRNGQSIGMRLFAIRRDSMYEKLGLKNGDILLAVNDASLSDPSQALKIFEQLKSERSIRVKLERNGESKDLSYSIR